MQLENTTTTPNFFNTTQPVTPNLTDDIVGYACLLISSIFYGANNLPVKHYETGRLFFKS